MNYSVEATIDAQLPFDISIQIAALNPHSYSVEVFEYDGGTKRFTSVKAKFGTGGANPKQRNQRTKLQSELVKQANIYGGIVQTHECYHEEGAPCVVEELTRVDLVPRGIRRDANKIPEGEG